jgi:dTMP kinase
MKRSDTGVLIAFEGIDGAGKTTQVGLLVDFLQSRGKRVLRSKEPTDGRWGRKIRQSASVGRMSLAEELKAFIEDRKEHVAGIILPALSRGEIVVLDRYFYSTIAYQGSRGADIDALTTEMLSIAPEPDAALLLDVPPKVGLARIEKGRGETPNAFETLETLEKVRSVFLRIAKTAKNVHVIDGTPAPSLVHEAVKLIVLNVLGTRDQGPMNAGPWNA